VQSYCETTIWGLQRQAAEIGPFMLEVSSLVSLRPADGPISRPFLQLTVQTAQTAEWLAVGVVQCEPVSDPNSLLTGKLSGNPKAFRGYSRIHAALKARFFWSFGGHT
jgi:hypothetical protein